MGLNVGWAPEGAASLGSITAGPVAPARLLGAVLEAFDSLPDDIDDAYRSELVTVGRSVRVELPSGDGALLGRAIEVDDRGRLVVLDADGVRHELDVGDVVHVRDLDP
jgi:BirA family biotin operon repressor/biotin-[acetyl-CoA-carboxylase] ligase